MNCKPSIRSCLGVVVVLTGLSGTIACRPSDSKANLRPSNPKAGQVIANCIGMNLVYVPSGEFQMGSPNEEIGHESDEALRPVEVSQGFYMGQTEVTVAQFRRFSQLSDKPWIKPSFEQGEDHPAVEINWSDAVKYCEWLSQEDGYPYRLPTEVEWEHACRAGTTRRFSFGDSDAAILGKVNIFGEGDPFPHTSPAEYFPPNRFGLYGMHGNVTEWCSDLFHDPIRTKRRLTSFELTFRVARGGSWYGSARYVRSAYRQRRDPSKRDFATGFRVVSTTPIVGPE
jgi:formylglycine-generating enzyme required for sulfatase activity